MSVKELREVGRASAVVSEGLPMRAPGAAGVPDGPRAVSLSIERLELIADAVRRWCAEPGGPSDHR